MKKGKAVNKALTYIPNTKEPPEAPAEVLRIAPNVCMEKGMCSCCGRGDRYGIPLHFIFHCDDGSLNTVCFACGKGKADKTGLKLPLTESDIFAAKDIGNMLKIRRGLR